RRPVEHRSSRGDASAQAARATGVSWCPVGAPGHHRAGQTTSHLKEHMQQKETGLTNWINEKLIALHARTVADEGQGTVEYAVVLGVLVVLIVGAFKTADVGAVIGTAIDKVEGL